MRRRRTARPTRRCHKVQLNYQSDYLAIQLELHENIADSF